MTTILQELKLTQRKFPQLRYGQIIFNAIAEQGKIMYVDGMTNSDVGRALFYINDDELIKAIHHFRNIE